MLSLSVSRTIGLDSIYPAGIGCNANATCSAQIVDGEEHLISREFRTKSHNVFHHANGTSLQQCCDERTL